MTGQFSFRRFVLGEHFAGARDDFVRQACEFGDFDAVATVGCAGLNFAQEGDAAAGFFY